MSAEVVADAEDRPAGQPGVVKTDPILVVDSVRRAFGGLVAVDVDHAEVQRGEISALIGPNGAGKTTFFNLLTGFDEPNTGQWTFDGVPVAHTKPHRLARLGMVRTFQLTKSLARLSVIQNMRLGATGQRGERLWAAPWQFAWGVQERSITERADELLQRFRLDQMRDEFAGNLSGGQRKLLEMARALMTDPKLIMLDEPMAGVNPALKQSLLNHIHQLKSEGRTVLFVEHDMDMVHEISDWVLVMAEGRLIAEGTAAEISGNQAVIDAYLGAHHDVDIGAMDEAEAIEQLGLDAGDLGVDTLQQIAEEHHVSDWGVEATEEPAG
ncbi:MAG TPA: ABC transporter ATP-binding protein [Desertimonas sp.]|nr:ABC transporter ATP-binding protein [Desertimonas sp.]